MKCRRTLITVAACIVALLALLCTGCDEYIPKADYGYKATGMTVTAKINADNTVDITEELDIYFSAPSHGLIRTLPLEGGVRYENLSYAGDRAELSHEYAGLLCVRFGREDREYFMESKHYTVRYTAVLPEACNTLSYNFIGDDFDMVRENVTVNIESFCDISDIKVYVGFSGSDDSRATVKKTSPRTLKITLEGEDGLQPFEGITADVGLTQAQSMPSDYTPVVVWAVGAVLVAAAAVLWFVKCRQEKPLPVVSFYPPKDDTGVTLNPAEAGLLIDNSCSPGDVTSLIFHWAAGGYLDISEENDGTEFIYKKPLPSTTPDYEKTLFKRLFADADTEEGEKKVALSSLTNRFYTSISKAQNSINGRYTGKLYEKGGAVLAFVFGLLSVLFVAFVVLSGYLKISGRWINPIGLVAALPAVVVALVGLYLSRNRFKLSRGSLLGIGLCYVLLAAAFATLLLFVLPSDVCTISVKIALGVCGCAVILIAPFMNRRTKFYNDTLGELIGFRDFIIMAEKEKLEMLLKDDPQYYYNILPYANVLGVTKIWQDKFASLTLEPPRYYRTRSGDVFTVLYFNRVYNTCNNRCRDVLVSRPRSSGGSGGGSHGGGGRVGGGFGGGGSRRW